MHNGKPNYAFRQKRPMWFRFPPDTQHSSHSAQHFAFCLLSTAFLLLLTAPVRAQDLPTTAPAASTDVTPDVNDTSPVLADHGIWAGAMVIIVLGLFLAAAVIGPVVRADAPNTIAAAFSHHENPSHHTGRESDAVPLPHEPPR